MTTSISTAERLAADLSRAILRGELLPGEPIRQDEWAARLGVSKVPFREALKLLGARHLIYHEPNRGYFVPKMAADELAQIYEIRAFLDAAVLDSVRWPTAEEYRNLKESSERAMLAAEAGNIATFLEEEQSFFFELYDLSPLGVYVREAKLFWTACDQYRAAGLVTILVTRANLDRMRERRRRLLQAVEDRNHGLLVTIVRDLRVNLSANFHLGRRG